MREAMLYEGAGEGRVRCRLCAHGCVIRDGGRGLCGVRENSGGKLYSLAYGKLCAANADPVEKKPLYHFLPGSSTYSVSAVGCNFRCKHCQNWEISQAPRDGGRIYGGDASPGEIVASALSSGCKSVSYTYTEPTVFMEYALDTAVAAREAGLRNVFVSNGYMSEEAVGAMAPSLDADNVDLKAFTEGFYRDVCGASLEPVLRTLKDLVGRGVWVEVTTLIIPSLNDGEGELKQIADFIAGELGLHVPWHVSRFHPDYKLTHLPATDVKAVAEAVEIGRKAGLKHVYGGNVPHGGYENTYCPGCGGLLIERRGFTVARNVIGAGACPECGCRIEGVWQ